VEWSVDNGWLVLGLAVGFAALGVYIAAQYKQQIAALCIAVSSL